MEKAFLLEKDRFYYGIATTKYTEDSFPIEKRDTTRAVFQSSQFEHNVY